MLKSSHRFAAVCALGVLVVLGLFVVLDQEPPSLHNSATSQTTGATTGPKNTQSNVSRTIDPLRTQPVAGPGQVVEGGVVRDKTDLVERSTASNNLATSRSPRQPQPGKSPVIPANENKQVSQVMDALQDHTSPGTFNAFRTAEPFDLQQWRDNPQVWLETVAPGRVFQAAQPAADVPVLHTRSRTWTRLIQGETVVLKVQGAPSSPITFLSTDLGEFQNRLTTITVASDAEGFAEARFRATPGTRGDVEIMAASPMASGQARFIVHVTIPKDRPLEDRSSHTEQDNGIQATQDEGDHQHD